jgi:DNA-binding LacI/PurR family transcriptional regulator
MKMIQTEYISENTHKKTVRDPLYKKIAATIRGEIKNNYSPNDPLPSQRELAQRFKTSYLTVNNAIQQLVQEGLVTSTVGSGTFICEPTKRSRGLVSIVMPDKSEKNPIYWSMLFETIEKDLRTAGFRPIVFGGCDNREEGERTIAEIGHYNENGIILYGRFVDKYIEQLHSLQSRGIHMVTINHPHGFDCSRVSHRMIGVLQANYIIQKGYKRILYFSIQNNKEEEQPPFLQGFISTMMKHGSELIPLQLVTIAEKDYEDHTQVELDIRQQLAEITRKAFTLSDQPKPDVIVVYGDSRLPTIVDVLRSLNIVPGQDVTLFGNDDQNLTGFPYVTVNEGLSEIGHKAVELLMDRIEGKYTGESRIVDITPKIIEHGIQPVVKS